MNLKIYYTRFVRRSIPFLVLQATGESVDILEKSLGRVLLAVDCEYSKSAEDEDTGALEGGCDVDGCSGVSGGGGVE